MSTKAKELLTMFGSYILMVFVSIQLSNLDLPRELIYLITFFVCFIVAILVLTLSWFLWYIREPEKRVSFGRALIWRGTLSLYDMYCFFLMNVTGLVLAGYIKGGPEVFPVYSAFFIASVTELVLMTSIVLVATKEGYYALERLGKLVFYGHFFVIAMLSIPVISPM